MNNITQFQELHVKPTIIRALDRGSLYNSVISTHTESFLTVESKMASAAEELLVIGSQTFQLVQKQLRTKDYKPPLYRAKKVPRADANYRVTEGNIAAIDFGTTSVSLAYTTKGDEKVNTLILDAQEKAARDTNAVLLKREGKAISVTAFGNTARSQFTTARKSENYDKENIYFERIKMLLKRKKVSYNLQLMYAWYKYFFIEYG